MRLRKFEILRIELSPGGPGPERAWQVFYKAIKNKKWKNGSLWVIARTVAEAQQKAQDRFGGID
jgi:hypothetical protein